MNNIPSISLKILASKFDRASRTYQANDTIQRIPAEKISGLLAQVLNKTSHNNKLKILDLGCGSGIRLNQPLQQSSSNPNVSYIGLDLSHKMLNLCNYPQKIIADAHNIPILSNSIDIVLSNLMIQWSNTPEKIILEIKRVLKPRGTLIISTLVSPSLREINKLWSSIDNTTHSLNFITSHDFLKLYQPNNFVIQQRLAFTHSVYPNSAYSLFKHFKATGTSLPVKNQTGLNSRTRINKFIQKYDSLVKYENLQIPVKYDYLVVLAYKI